MKINSITPLSGILTSLTTPAFWRADQHSILYNGANGAVILIRSTTSLLNSSLHMATSSGTFYKHNKVHQLNHSQDWQEVLIVKLMHCFYGDLIIFKCICMRSKVGEFIEDLSKKNPVLILYTSIKHSLFDRWKLEAVLFKIEL